MTVKDTEKPMVITIQNNPLSIPEPAYHSMSVDPDGRQSRFHTVKIHNESFRSVFDVKDKANVTLTVLIRQNKRPTFDNYLMQWSLPDNSSCTWKNETIHRNESIDLFRSDPSEYVCTRDVYAVFISDKENLDGVFYLGKFTFNAIRILFVQLRNYRISHLQRTCCHGNNILCME